MAHSVSRWPMPSSAATMRPSTAMPDVATSPPQPEGSTDLTPARPGASIDAGRDLGGAGDAPSRCSGVAGEALRKAQLTIYRNPHWIPALARLRGADFAENDLPS